MSNCHDIESQAEVAVAGLLQASVNVLALKLPIVLATSFEDMMDTEATSELIRVRCNEAVPAVTANGLIMSGVFRASVAVEVISSMRGQDEANGLEQKDVVRGRTRTVRQAFMDSAITTALTNEAEGESGFRAIGFDLRRYYTERSGAYILTGAEYEIICSGS